MTSVDDPRPESSSTPFWRGVSVGGLMALMVPVALYCADFSLSREFYRKYREFYDTPPHFNLGMASELSLLFLSGVVLAFYRRATIREAAVQWCVPPIFLILFWTFVLSGGSSLGFAVVLIAIVISFASLSAWLQNERGGTLLPWPENWIFESILVGFANVGLMMLMMLSSCCFLPPVLSR